MRTPSSVLSVGAVILLGCSSSSHSTSDGGATDGGDVTGAGGASSSEGGTRNGTGGRAVSGAGGMRPADDAGTGVRDGGSPATACEPFGRYPAPEKTFTLPKGDGLYFPDVQKSFPDVDWANLDRLYVPAGVYKEFNLGNLPERSASRPLVITNLGGQVQVGPNPGGNYIWSMGGGSHWILSGRYDEDAKTGDAAFAGHRCGQYAASRGKYGFLSDDAFATGQWLHMGVGVTNSTDFEIEYVEVTRSGFAGIRLLNERAADDPAFAMANVKIHDNYIHDTGGEGTYFGWTGAPPANLLPGLSIYNNRIVRTGNEALQIQDLGDGTEVYGNVFAFAAMHWRDNGLGKYQDNNSQIQTREGTIRIHDNVFVGGAGTLLSFWSQPEDGDGDRHVTFENNYFGGTKSLVAYLGGAAAASSDFRFVHNFFRDTDFGYDLLDPAAKPPAAVFQITPDYAAPVTFEQNAWEGSLALVAGLSSGDGTKGTVTGRGNVNGAVQPIDFEDTGYPSGTPVQALEMWAPVATLSPATPSPGITYHPGDVVMFDAVMYQCTKDSTNETPPDHPAAWRKLPLPVDDFRVKAGSVYEQLGVH